MSSTISKIRKVVGWAFNPHAIEITSLSVGLVVVGLVSAAIIHHLLEAAIRTAVLQISEGGPTPKDFLVVWEIIKAPIDLLLGAGGTYA